MPVKKYCAGHNVDLTVFDSVAIHGTPLYNRIYQEVRAVPYGSTATYSEIAARSGTIPRVVGQAMARNITPLVIPCHRIVGTHGIGGFSPSVEIKEMLLAMEQKTMRKKKP
jgi:methylated-DNA-[protein]-cysteine S-methyltransferase